MSENTVRDKEHWLNEHHVQRITTAEWKELLLIGLDSMIFKGDFRQLEARSIGSGVVEIYKIPVADNPFRKRIAVLERVVEDIASYEGSKALYKYFHQHAEDYFPSPDFIIATLVRSAERELKERDGNEQ